VIQNSVAKQNSKIELRAGLCRILKALILQERRLQNSVVLERKKKNTFLLFKISVSWMKN